eukprot:7912801-Alexandrium_andersonii.AAC.1
MELKTASPAQVFSETFWAFDLVDESPQLALAAERMDCFNRSLASDTALAVAAKQSAQPCWRTASTICR